MSIKKCNNGKIRNTKTKRCISLKTMFNNIKHGKLQITDLLPEDVNVYIQYADVQLKEQKVLKRLKIMHNLLNEQKLLFDDFSENMKSLYSVFYLNIIQEQYPRFTNEVLPVMLPIESGESDLDEFKEVIDVFDIPDTTILLGMFDRYPKTPLYLSGFKNTEYLLLNYMFSDKSHTLVFHDTDKQIMVFLHSSMPCTFRTKHVYKPKKILFRNSNITISKYEPLYTLRQYLKILRDTHSNIEKERSNIEKELESNLIDITRYLINNNKDPFDLNAFIVNEKTQKITLLCDLRKITDDESWKDMYTDSLFKKLRKHIEPLFPYYYIYIDSFIH